MLTAIKHGQPILYFDESRVTFYHQVVGYSRVNVNEHAFFLPNTAVVSQLTFFISQYFGIALTTRLAKQIKAERCFGNQCLAIAFHIFVKLWRKLIALCVVNATVKTC